MKTASAATLAILATGQYLKFEFYDITLADATVLRFTNADVPIKVGANTYQTGLVISRSSIHQKMGLAVQSFDLEIAPQWDNPAGAITVAGYPFLRAVNLGTFDGARVLFSKGFFNPPAYGALDTSPGLVEWSCGKVSDAVAGRTKARITVSDDTQQLNVMMPRNVLQTGCVHSLFNAGCGLVKATFTQAGAITATGPNSTLSFTTNLAAASAYYDLGQIVFVTGANAGLSRTVKGHSNTNGTVNLIVPLPFIPGTGDTFNIIPGCDKQQATCSSKFSNSGRFRGYPFIPVPETLYDGGTPNAPAPSIGTQGGGGAGSAFTGLTDENSYAP